MKKILLQIALFILGAFTIWWMLGSITMFTNSDIDMSDRIGGGIAYLILAIVCAVPFAFLLRKHLISTKGERQLAKIKQQAEITHQAQLQQMELERQQLQHQKESELRKKALLEQQRELAAIVSENHVLANTPQVSSSPPAPTVVPHPQPAPASVTTEELLLLKIDSLSTSGIYFENVACELLKANGFKNVETTQSTNDYGIDILAEKDGITYAIQCKCYSSSIGNKAVQEAYTGKGYYNRMVAVVLTNSTFSKSAVETANATQVLLWDRTKLTEMISALDDENIKALLNVELHS